MNHLQSQANKEKVESGKLNLAHIETLLKLLQQDRIISSFEKEVHVGKSGFEYPTQYMANYLIKTFNSKYIVVRTTNSHRQDRYKIPAYDIEGILKNAPYSKDIIASVYLLPDKELANPSFLNLRTRVHQKIEYSPFNYCFVIEEFKEFLENLRSSTIGRTGSEFAKQGILFEQTIVSILNTEGELQRYRKGTSDRITARILDHLIATHGVTKPDILNIHASDTITHLRSGGPSKTDFWVSMETGKGTFIETFSAKNTSEKAVTCHEYDYTGFSRVLNCQGSKLEEYLRLFQKYGGYQRLENNLPDQYSLREFEKLLADKSTVLTEWALSGKHDGDNIIDPEKQIVRNMIIKQNDIISCFTVQDYIEKMSRNTKSNKSQLGTLFTWTYHDTPPTESNPEGKRIQFKMPVLIKEF